MNATMKHTLCVVNCFQVNFEWTDYGSRSQKLSRMKHLEKGKKKKYQENGQFTYCCIELEFTQCLHKRLNNWSPHDLLTCFLCVPTYFMQFYSFQIVVHNSISYIIQCAWIRRTLNLQRWAVLLQQSMHFFCHECV